MSLIPHDQVIKQKYLLRDIAFVFYSDCKICSLSASDQRGFQVLEAHWREWEAMCDGMCGAGEEQESRAAGR